MFNAIAGFLECTSTCMKDRTTRYWLLRIYMGKRPRSSTEPARATLLQRGDASRGSSTESARATLLQSGDASRASSTESARATLLQRGDASRGSCRLARHNCPLRWAVVPRRAGKSKQRLTFCWYSWNNYPSRKHHCARVIRAHDVSEVGSCSTNTSKIWMLGRIFD